MIDIESDLVFLELALAITIDVGVLFSKHHSRMLGIVKRKLSVTSQTTEIRDQIAVHQLLFRERWYLLLVFDVIVNCVKRFK